MDNYSVLCRREGLRIILFISLLRISEEQREDTLAEIPFIKFLFLFDAMVKLLNTARSKEEECVCTNGIEDAFKRTSSSFTELYNFHSGFSITAFRKLGMVT